MEKDSKKFWDRDTVDRKSLIAMGNTHFQWLEIQGYSSYTIKQSRHRLKYFVHFCEERGIRTVAEMTGSLIESYQRYLYQQRRDSDSKPYSPGYRRLHLNTLTVFFKWLKQNDHIFYNPASALDKPRLPKKIPQQLLTAQQAEYIIKQPDTKTPLGIRDRAILEILYSTGIRRCEMSRLKIGDINFDQGTVMVKGKGGTDRVVPIGDRALIWIERYLDVRSLFCRREEDPLFIGKSGQPLSINGIAKRVVKYVKAADIGKKGSCHMFRHTMATLMLEGGADIRYIQQILGHKNIDTTQIYTKVSIHKLQQVHARTHPAKLMPTKTAQVLRELDQIE